MTYDGLNEVLAEAPVQSAFICHVGVNDWYVNNTMNDGRGHYGEGHTTLDALSVGSKSMQEYWRDRNAD